MKNRTKFILISLWILSSRSFDAYSTYRLSSDLTNEANPLVSVLGVSSWNLLFLLVGLLTIYVLYALYIRLYRPTNLMPTESGLSFTNFISYYYFGYKTHWANMLYKVPNNLNRLHTYMGELLSITLSFAGLLTTIMWLLIYNIEGYKNLHSPSIVYSILIIGFLVIFIYWHFHLYKKYRKFLA